MTAIFEETLQIPGIYGVKVKPCCIDRPNRYDIMIEIEMDKEALPAYDFKGVKVLLTGVLVDSIPLLDMLSANDIAVVGDLTITESARYATDIPGKVDPYDSFAAIWQDVRGVSVALDPKKERGDMLVDLAHERGADGVVACIVKFCETEEFDVPVLKVQMERANLPLLVIEVESQETASEQASTRIQAFAEMIDMAR